MGTWGRGEDAVFAGRLKQGSLSAALLAWAHPFVRSVMTRTGGKPLDSIGALQRETTQRRMTVTLELAI